MKVKLTEEKDLFSLLETEEEHEWYNSQDNQPLSLQILGIQHMYVVGEIWNKNFVGNSIWMRYKT